MTQPSPRSPAAHEHDQQVQAYFDQPLYCSKQFNLRLRAEIVGEMLGPSIAGSMIDLGCGDGSVSLPFLSADVHLTAIDLSETMLERLRQKIPPGFAPRVTIIQAGLESVAETPAYDIVLCLGVLAHVSSTRAVLEKIHRLLKPGGRCVLQLTNCETLVGRLRLWLVRRFKKNAYQYGYRLNQTSLSEVLEICRELRLELQTERKYSLLLPKFSFIPDWLLYRAARLSLTLPWLSYFGSEVLLCLRKTS